jgi:hypothetical protein
MLLTEDNFGTVANEPHPFRHRISPIGTGFGTLALHRFGTLPPDRRLSKKSAHPPCFGLLRVTVYHENGCLHCVGSRAELSVLSAPDVNLPVRFRLDNSVMDELHSPLH